MATGTQRQRQGQQAGPAAVGGTGAGGSGLENGGYPGLFTSDLLHGAMRCA